MAKNKPENKKAGPLAPLAPLVGCRVISRRVDNLDVQLTEKELLEFGQQIAQAEGNLQAHQLHAKQIKDQLKATEAKLDAELAYLGACLRRKAEPRDVEIQTEEDNNGLRQAIDVRADTHEVIHRRPLRNDELQMELLAENHDPNPSFI